MANDGKEVMVNRLHGETVFYERLLAAGVEETEEYEEGLARLRHESRATPDCAVCGRRIEKSEAIQWNGNRDAQHFPSCRPQAAFLAWAGV